MRHTATTTRTSFGGAPQRLVSDLRVLDRLDQPPDALELLRGPKGGIPERKALDAHVDVVLQDFSSLVRRGRREHQSPLGWHAFHDALDLPLILDQDDRGAHGPR